jgi:hypothetical protein
MAQDKVAALAEREGYVRTFVDYGPPIQRLLKQAAMHRSTPYILEILLAFPVAPNKRLPQPSPEPSLSHVKVASELG